MVARAAGRTIIRISCCLSLGVRMPGVRMAGVGGQLAGVLGGRDCEAGAIDPTVLVVVLVCGGPVP